MMEREVKREIDKYYGFDINYIKEHYKFRSFLRNQYKVLSHGKMIALTCENKAGIIPTVLTFARYTQNEIAIIAANFNDKDVNC